MKVLTSGEVAEWFETFKNIGDKGDYVRGDDRGPFYTHTEAACIDLEYPQKLERLSYFARYIATIGYEDRDFTAAAFGRGRVRSLPPCGKLPRGPQE
jgi:hypothetical protein